MHLLSLVADRLWLVKGGTVTPYEGDLDSYRTLLLSPQENIRKPTQKPEKKKEKPSRDTILKLRQEVRACEARVDKLMEMEGKVARKLADPDIYEDPGTLATWQRKYAEIEEGILRAESLWEDALARLERAEG
jgi:ATP-binding cassette subfamily F protein 3